MNGSYTTAKELAEYCSVSVRTIQRDLDALSLAGIPICSSRGYGGGVGLLKEFTLDKAFMTEQEQTDILHGLQALQGTGYADANDLSTNSPPFSEKKWKTAGCAWIFPPGALRALAKKNSTG